MSNKANENLVLGFGIFCCLSVLCGITVAWALKTRDRNADGVRQVVAIVKAWPGVVDADAMTENKAVWMLSIQVNSTISQEHMRAYGCRFVELAKPFSGKGVDFNVTVLGMTSFEKPRMLMGTQEARGNTVAWVDPFNVGKD